jgi:hypothetical protein
LQYFPSKAKTVEHTTIHVKTCLTISFAELKVLDRASLKMNTSAFSKSNFYLLRRNKEGGRVSFVHYSHAFVTLKDMEVVIFICSIFGFKYQIHSYRT